MEPFASFLASGEIALVSCCNVGLGGSRYSIAVVHSEGIDWLNLDSVIDPGKDKGVNGIAANADHCVIAVPGAHERLISLDRRLRPVDIFSCARARDLHSVSLHDGRAYFASTGTNEILSVGCVNGIFSGPERTEVTLGATDNDEVHLNSVLAGADGSLLYTAFGVGPRTPVRQLGALVDHRSGQVVIDGLMDPHSIVKLPDGRFAFCESMTNSLCIVEPKSGALSRVGLRGYTRGIAYTENHLMVGSSFWRSRSRSSAEVRNAPTFVGSGLGSHTKQSSLFILHSDLTLAHAIDFTPYAPEIYDVVFLGYGFSAEAVFTHAAQRRRESQTVCWPNWFKRSARA